jgi:CheY-like chemotaxis protein
MSHELRTPLNAILNVAETLEEQVYGPLNERQLRAVHTQEESANHLLSLINDILDLSKIGAGKFELMMDLVPVPALCSASLKLVEEAAKKKDIHLSMVVDPPVKHVWGDLRRLKQVLVNLLSNAVKFTPQGGFVGLAVAGDPLNNQVRVMVWDTGIGIPEESIPNLFKPFIQLDNSLSRKYEGTGLGLALAYHIVEMHGGGIQISSEEGKGSQFTITLNWDDSNLQPSPAVTQAQAIGGFADIETYSSFGIKAQRLFSEFGIEFVSFFHDAQNFEKIVQAAPNVIVLNIPLNSECRAFISHLREDPRTQAVPILIPINAMEPGNNREIPAGVIPFNISSSRQEFRNILKTVSVSGTASLIRKVVLINPRKGNCREEETTILLVDDNEATVRPLSDYLVSRGYRVIMAYSGAEAVLHARENRPDLILMDIQMPGMDGIEAIRRIRADDSIRKIPVIALTALAMSSDRQRCLDAGANEYISKPISLRYLIEIIEAQFRQTGTSAG